MKKLLLAGVSGLALLSFGSANAADLGVRPAYKAPPPPPPPLFSWTGFYVGGHFGAGWARNEWSQTSFDVSEPQLKYIPEEDLEMNGGNNGNLGSIGSHNALGPLGGFQVGYNYQWGPVVLGIEGEFSFADLKGDHQTSFSQTSVHNFNEPDDLVVCIDSEGCTEQVVNTFNAQERVSTQVRDIATIAARFGITSGPQDRTLWYVKGGAAWVRDRFGVSASSNDLRCDTILRGLSGIAEPCENESFAGSASGDHSRWGFVVGTGVEFGLFDNWSAKIEYDFLDFGSQDIVLSGTGTQTFSGGVPVWTEAAPFTAHFKVDQQIHVVKIGLNYRFNWFGKAPVVASY